MNASKNSNSGSSSARSRALKKLQILLILSLTIPLVPGGMSNAKENVAARTSTNEITEKNQRDLFAQTQASTVIAEQPQATPVAKEPAKGEKATDKDKTDKSDKTDKTDKDKSEKADKGAEKPASPKPEPVIENVQNVSAEDLVSKPHDFMGKNVKFTANFSAFNNLALDYKPAFRSSKTHLSFLVHRAKSKVPLSELKLAMAIPKEKEPETTLLATLKEGEPIEVVGKVFSAALDDPWVEVLKIRKLNADKDDKKSEAAKTSEKSGDSKGDKASGGKPDADSKDKPKAPSKN